MDGQYEGLKSLLAVLKSSGSAPSGRPSPDDEPFLALIRAGLEQSISPQVADKAIALLRDEGLLEPGELAGIRPRDLDTLFRTHRLAISPKTVGPLLKLSEWFAASCPDGDPVDHSTDDLRAEWRRIKGLGRSTVDALLLALGRPTYPIDRPSYRIFARHGWIDPSMDEDEARSTFESLAPGAAPELAWLSGQLQQVAATHCKVARPHCECCPLRPLLPASGPIEE